MSDNALTNNLTLEAVVNHLKKFSPGQCEFCGSKQWLIYKNPDDLVGVTQPNLFIKNEDGSQSLLLGGGVPVVQVQCQKCGQVKYFSLPAILKSLENSNGTEQQK